MQRTFKYQLTNLNKINTIVIDQNLKTCCWFYNFLLEGFRNRDKNKQKQPTERELQNSLPQIKRDNSFLKEVQSQTLQDVAKRVYKTWQRYKILKVLEPKKKYPNFKPHHRYNSFVYSQSITKKGCGYKIDNSSLNKKKENRKISLSLGRQNNHNIQFSTNIKLSRNIQGDIKTLTIKRKNGRYYALFSCDNIEPKTLPITNKKVGLDLGIKNLIATSDGQKIKNPKFYKKSEKIIKKAQQRLNNKVEKSKNWLDAKLQLAKKWEKVVNQFKHYSYQAVNSLVKKYDGIAVEDLNVKGMLEKKMGDGKKSLRRSLNSVKFGVLLKVISEAAEIATRRFVRVNPRNTTQKCSSCGELSKEKLNLTQRIFECRNCDYKDDRDINSARNIYKLGFDRNLLSEIRGKELWNLL